MLNRVTVYHNQKHYNKHSYFRALYIQHSWLHRYPVHVDMDVVYNTNACHTLMIIYCMKVIIAPLSPPKPFKS